MHANANFIIPTFFLLLHQRLFSQVLILFTHENILTTSVFYFNCPENRGTFFGSASEGLKVAFNIFLLLVNSFRLELTYEEEEVAKQN